MTLPPDYVIDPTYYSGGRLLPVDDYSSDVFADLTGYPLPEIATTTWSPSTLQTTEDITTQFSVSGGGGIFRGHHVPGRGPPAPALAYSVKYVVNGILIPAILTFGAFGNAFCLALIVNRVCRCPRLPLPGCRAHRTGQFNGSPPCPNRINPTSTAGGSACGSNGRRKLQPLERTALVGLGLLALSDLMFCLVGVPAAWLPSNAGSMVTAGSSGGTLGQYYTIYRYPLHNLFLVSSSWIAVTIAIERCIAVGCPIRARWFLKVMPARDRFEHFF